MVVIEAAAITAGSVAAYHGGKKAVSESAKKFRRMTSFKEKKKDRDDVIASRKEQRRERMADVNKYRESFKRSMSSRTEGATLPQFNWKKDASNARSNSSYSGRSSSASSQKWWES
mmetsp:Transcript_20232/g.47552  ORF Transcript_20232/g.47552 Transcript_20232/m.47552 type:complete len:116 (+) Transcript_20232:414-761(+)